MSSVVEVQPVHSRPSKSLVKEPESNAQQIVAALTMHDELREWYKMPAGK